MDKPRKENYFTNPFCVLLEFSGGAAEMAAAREVVNLFSVNRGSQYLVNGMCTETGILWCCNGHLRRRKQH